MATKEKLLQLITEYYENETARKMYTDISGRLKAEIIQALHMEGADAFPHPDFEVKLTSGRNTPNMELIRPLLESPIGDELIDSGAFIPAHTETKEIPDSVDYTQLNSFKKYGTRYAEVIEKSKIRAPGLSVKPKKTKKNGA